MKNTFLNLNRREQSLVVIFLVAIVLISLVLLNSYLRYQRGISEQNYLTTKQTYLDLQQAIKLKSEIRLEEPANISNINSVVSSLARSLNLTIDRIQPAGTGEIMVSLNQANFLALFEWIRQLEDSKGIIVSKASIRKNSTTSNQSEVRAQLVLKVFRSN